MKVMDSNSPLSINSMEMCRLISDRSTFTSSFKFTDQVSAIIQMDPLKDHLRDALVIFIASMLAALFLNLGILVIPLSLIPPLTYLIIHYEKHVGMSWRNASITLLLLPLISFILSLQGGILSRSMSAALSMISLTLGVVMALQFRGSGLSLSVPLSGLSISAVALMNILAGGFPPIFTQLIGLILLLSLSIGLYSVLRWDRGSIRLQLPLDYILEVILLSLFFAFEFIASYHGVMRMVSNDLLYHQNHAYRLLHYPSTYRQWSYFGYHSLLAGIYALAESTPLYLMISASLLNFAALIMVAAAFSHLEERREVLFIWSFLTGFGWLAILRFGTGLRGLQLANTFSYRSIIWSQPIFFWALPLTLGLALLALLIHVDSTEAEGWRKLLATFILTTFAFLVHVAEALVFAAYLVLASLLLGVGSRGRRYTSLGSALSGALLTALYLAPNVYRGAGPGTAPYLLAASILALVLNELRGRAPLSGIIDSLMEWLRDYSRQASLLLVSILASGLVVWFIHLGEVDVESIYLLGHVPWFFYPVLLGVTSFIAAFQLRFRFRAEYALLVLASLAIGRFITYYKLAGHTISYWEYRFPLYASLGLAVLAAPLIRKLARRSSREWGAALLLGLIFLSGYGTTVASVRAWHDVDAYNMGTLTQADFEFAANSTFFRTHRVPLLTLTSYSLAAAVLMNPPSILKQLVPWLSSGPEIPLHVLSRFARNGSLAVLFTVSDLGFLERNNASFGYLRRFMGPLTDYPSITTVRLSPPPEPNSSLAVVFPPDTYVRRRALVAYELIRDRLPVHTTYLSDDPMAPAGIYVGPASPQVRVEGELPADPHDLRWLYIWGNFTRGLEVSGKRNVAVLSYELDEGSYELRACGMMTGYVGLYYDFHDFSSYRFLQVYLDRGVAISRVVEDGRVSSGHPVRVPVRASDRCANITLSLREGNLTASVNGRTIALPRVERLGVLGLETGGFSGRLEGRVSGVERLRWDPPAGSRVLNVMEGRLADLIDEGLRNISRTRLEARDLELGDLPLAASGNVPDTEAVAACSDLNATGTVLVRGRPIWVESGGARRYLDPREVEIRARGLRFRGGEGFYVDLDLTGVSAPFQGDVTVRFRTPVQVTMRGNVTIFKFHRLVSSVTRAPNLRVGSANATIMMADNSLVFSSIEVPPSQARKSLYRAFDETRYLPEAVVLMIVVFAALMYLDRRLVWESSRKAVRRSRAGRNRVKGGRRRGRER